MTLFIDTGIVKQQTHHPHRVGLTYSECRRCALVWQSGSWNPFVQKHRCTVSTHKCISFSLRVVCLERAFRHRQITAQRQVRRKQRATFLSAIFQSKTFQPLGETEGKVSHSEGRAKKDAQRRGKAEKSKHGPDTPPVFSYSWEKLLF